MRMIVLLMYPFNALLLEQQSYNQHKRVAAENEIIVPGELQRYPGKGHGVGDRLNGMEYVTSSASFLWMSIFDQFCCLAFSPFPLLS